MSAKSVVLRARLSPADLRALRLAAARADKRPPDYNGEVIRAGLKALNGRGEK